MLVGITRGKMRKTTKVGSGVRKSPLFLEYAPRGLKSLPLVDRVIAAEASGAGSFFIEYKDSDHPRTYFERRASIGLLAGQTLDGHLTKMGIQSAFDSLVRTAVSDIGPVERILIIGCGTGKTTLTIASELLNLNDRKRRVLLCATDVSPDFYVLSRSRLSAMLDPNLFRLAMLCWDPTTPFPSHLLDVKFNSIYWIGDGHIAGTHNIPAIIRNAYDLLLPNGNLVAVETCPRIPFENGTLSPLRRWILNEILSDPETTIPISTCLESELERLWVGFSGGRTTSERTKKGAFRIHSNDGKILSEAVLLVLNKPGLQDAEQ